MPDRAHGPTLNDEEDDLGCMAQAGEGEEGPEEDFEREGAHMADDAEDRQADRDLDETDTEDVEDLAESGGVQGRGNVGGWEAMDVLTKAGSDEDGEVRDCDDARYLCLKKTFTYQRFDFHAIGGCL